MTVLSSIVLVNGQNVVVIKPISNLYWLHKDIDTDRHILRTHTGYFYIKKVLNRMWLSYGFSFLASIVQ